MITCTIYNYTIQYIQYISILVSAYYTVMEDLGAFIRSPAVMATKRHHGGGAIRQWKRAPSPLYPAPLILFVVPFPKYALKVNLLVFLLPAAKAVIPDSGHPH